MRVHARLLEGVSMEFKPSWNPGAIHEPMTRLPLNLAMQFHWLITVRVKV